MKTLVNIIKGMVDLEVFQRTKDGYFYATLLLRQWNKSKGAKKEMKEFFLRYKQAKGFM